MRDWHEVLRRELNLPSMAGHRDERMIEELAEHLEQVYEEAVRAGATDAEAEARAIGALGDLQPASRELAGAEPAPVRGKARRWTEGKEDSFRTRGGVWTFLADRLRDLRLASRGLGRRPVFAAVVVLVLAIGIGGTVTIFTLIDAIVLSPLPFDEQDRLVTVSHTAPLRGIEDAGQSAAWHFTYEDGNDVFQDIGMWRDGSVIVTGAGDPETVAAHFVTSGVFRALRVRPEAGRMFTPADEDLAAPAIVILGHGYWQARFGGDPAVIGQTLDVDGRTSEIIGVMPASLTALGTDPAIIVPLRFDQSTLFVGNIGAAAVARLRDDVTIEQATADLSRLLPTAWDRYPGGPVRGTSSAEEYSVVVRPLKADLVGSAAQLLWVLFGGVAVVLLIACANVANLFLVRADSLETEMAVRTAMGATRNRITWEYLKESLLLGGLGGAAGVALAFWGVRMLVAAGPAQLPRLDEISLSPTVLVFALAVSLGAGALFGVIPRLRSGRVGMLTTLRLGGSGAIGGKQRRRTQNALVVGQIALTLILLVGSGLLLRSFVALNHVDPGFSDTDEVLAFRIFVPSGEVPTSEEAATTHELVARRVAELPGVTSVGLATAVPMDGGNNVNPFFANGVSRPGESSLLRRHKWIGADYFETLHIPVLVGRTFTWGDIHERFPGVIVSESLARELWGSVDAALGQQVAVRPEPIRWHEVVGVVPDVREDGMDQDPVPMVYWPQVTLAFWQGWTEDRAHAWRAMGYAVRSDRIGTAGFVRSVHDAVWEVNPNLALQNVSTVSDLMAASMARRSFTVVLIGVAAAVALILGVVGVYGVISYTVSQRSRELGMRLALGAGSRRVTALVVRQGLVLAAAGAGIGLLIAVAIAPLVADLLYGVGARDPLTLTVVPIGLMTVAAVASYLPARRAARLDPMLALRAD